MKARTLLSLAFLITFSTVAMDTPLPVPRVAPEVCAEDEAKDMSCCDATLVAWSMEAYTLTLGALISLIEPKVDADKKNN
jgi:hypothetical protein